MIEKFRHTTGCNARGARDGNNKNHAEAGYGLGTGCWVGGGGACACAAAGPPVVLAHLHAVMLPREDIRFFVEGGANILTTG